MSADEDWGNPECPPVAATDLGGGVWVSWGTAFNVGDEPLIWHWCSQEKWREQGRPVVDGPRWMAAGVRSHTLVARDPLHLEPSVYWPDCCGKHGFIRDGHWQEV